MARQRGSSPSGERMAKRTRGPRKDCRQWTQGLAWHGRTGHRV